MKKILCLLLIAVLSWPALALAQETALGASGLENRNQAISQAVTNANAQILMNKIAERVGAEVMAAALPRLSKEVFSNPAAYIANSRTLAVNQAEGQTWVLVQAQINDSALARLLDDLRGSSAASPPLTPILCLVCEDVAPGRPALYWWSGQPGLAVCPARIERGLRQLGYGPLAPGRILADLSPAISANMVLSEGQALTMGEQAGSKLVLWGRIRVYPILSATASESTPLVQLALLDVEQKRVISQVEVEGAVFRDTLPAGFESGMDKEVNEALSKLFSLGKVPVTPPPIQQITVEMEDVKSAAQLARLERTLLRLSEIVSQVRRESISSGRASLVVSATQDGLALAEQLSRLEDGGWLRIDERTPSRLRITPLEN